MQTNGSERTAAERTGHTPGASEEAAARELARQVERRIQALGSKNRAARLKAAHRLGRDLAGRAAPGLAPPPPGTPGPSAEQIERALAGLERLALDVNEGAWVRKRARRAIRKIRGEGEDLPLRAEPDPYPFDASGPATD